MKSRIGAGLMGGFLAASGGAIGALVGAGSAGEKHYGPATRKERERAKTGAVIGGLIGAVAGAALAVDPSPTKTGTLSGAPNPLRFP